MTYFFCGKSGMKNWKQYNERINPFAYLENYFTCITTRYTRMGWCKNIVGSFVLHIVHYHRTTISHQRLSGYNAESVWIILCDGDEIEIVWAEVAYGVFLLATGLAGSNLISMCIFIVDFSSNEFLLVS